MAEDFRYTPIRFNVANEERSRFYIPFAKSVLGQLDKLRKNMNVSFLNKSIETEDDVSIFVQSNKFGVNVININNVSGGIKGKDEPVLIVIFVSYWGILGYRIKTSKNSFKLLFCKAAKRGLRGTKFYGKSISYDSQMARNGLEAIGSIASSIEGQVYGGVYIKVSCPQNGLLRDETTYGHEDIFQYSRGYDFWVPSMSSLGSPHPSGFEFINDYFGSVNHYRTSSSGNFKYKSVYPGLETSGWKYFTVPVKSSKMKIFPIYSSGCHPYTAVSKTAKNKYFYNGNTDEIVSYGEQIVSDGVDYSLKYNTSNGWTETHVLTGYKNLTPSKYSAWGSPNYPSMVNGYSYTGEKWDVLGYGEFGMMGNKEFFYTKNEYSGSSYFTSSTTWKPWNTMLDPASPPVYVQSSKRVISSSMALAAGVTSWHLGGDEIFKINMGSLTQSISDRYDGSPSGRSDTGRGDATYDMKYSDTYNGGSFLLMSFDCANGNFVGIIAVKDVYSLKTFHEFYGKDYYVRESGGPGFVYWTGTDSVNVEENKDVIKYYLITRINGHLNKEKICSGLNMNSTLTRTSTTIGGFVEIGAPTHTNTIERSVNCSGQRVWACSCAVNGQYMMVTYNIEDLTTTGSDAIFNLKSRVVRVIDLKNNKSNITTIAPIADNDFPSFVLNSINKNSSFEEGNYEIRAFGIDICKKTSLSPPQHINMNNLKSLVVSFKKKNKNSQNGILIRRVRAKENALLEKYQWDDIIISDKNIITYSNFDLWGYFSDVEAESVANAINIIRTDTHIAA